MFYIFHMSKTNFEMPTKHLNGGDWERLGQQYYEALIKLEVLRERIAAIEFHPRDYYVVEGSFEKASQQRVEMFSNLQKVQDYLEKHCTHLFCA